MAALRGGDQAAFLELVARHHDAMVRVARAHVQSDAVAEEVAQEAWLGVLSGLGGFEGRASLKAWIFRILINCAKGRGQRERRSVPFSALAAEDEVEEPAVAPDRFYNETHRRWAGHWAAPPEPWPEERLLSAETLGLVRRAIDGLSRDQRDVITLRDVEGWSAEEVCEALGLSEVNQRVLLHRARAKVRRAIEAELQGTGGQT